MPKFQPETFDTDGHVEITAEHIAYTQKIATNLADRGSLLGQLAGSDELASESLVILWELALKFDPSFGVPFGAYLGQNVRRRLIDYLRLSYGRADSPGQREKMDANLAATSLDGLMEPTEGGAGYDAPAEIPSVEQTVIDREDLTAVMTYLNEECTDRQRDSMLWPATDESPEYMVAKYGMSRTTAHAHRHQTQAKVQRAIARGQLRVSR